MPRDLPVGNGTLLVNFDDTGTLRDVYYPHPGVENHTDGHSNHFGVWVAEKDGTQARFASLDADGWERHLYYSPGTLVTDIELIHRALGITLHLQDTVDFDRNVYIRKAVVHNDAATDKLVRLYFHFDAHLWSNNIGDTGYYDPRSRGLVFYKAARYFLLNAKVGEAVGLHQWAVGQKEVFGKEGTWRDAEDGQLSGNPVAQGSIDGTGGVELRIPSQADGTVYWWLAAGESIGVVGDLDTRMRERDPQTYLTRTNDYWKLWLAKESRDYANLPASVAACVNQSLLILRTNIDQNGAIIAGTDADILRFGRDTYAYLWPRDGALVATALVRAGYSDITRAFFRFVGNLITRNGYLLHKYNPDGSLGSTWHPFITPEGTPQLPIQEDETALVVSSLWEHFRAYREVEFVSPLYRPLVRNTAEFMTSFREPHTKLPAPSYDLWEERHGIHAWTVGSVWAGLMAAANYAIAFGQEDLAQEWRAAATEIRGAADTYLWDDRLGRFLRRIEVSADGTVQKDETIDASIIGLVVFGMYPPDDPRIVATMRSAEQALRVRTSVGGYARYQNDYYQQVSQDITNVPGNPWFICTLWMAEYAILSAKTRDDLKHAAELITWVVEHALPSGVLAEQVHPYSGAPLSVSPLTWSHAALVVAVQAYVAKWHQIETQENAPPKPTVQLNPNLAALPSTMGLPVAPPAAGGNG